MVFVEILLLAIATVYIFYKWSFSYWSRRNVPSITPSFPFGNTGSPFKVKLTSILRLQPHYDFGKSNGYKHCGLYLCCVPVYIPIDTNILKRIMVSDSDYFLNRGMYVNIRDDPLTGMVFAVPANLWRRLRILLTPTFTSGKMKAMFPVVLKCSNQMIDVLHKMDHTSPVDMKELAACYTTDVICACSFGLDCNTCANPNDEMRLYGKKTVEFDKRRRIKYFFTQTFPNLCRFLRVKIVPEDVNNFFVGTMKKTIDYRKTNNVYRKDLIQSLMEMIEEKKLTFDELTAQAFAFFLAGFETSSSATTFCLLELAQHQDIQEKVRKNVKDVIGKHNGEITYDGLTEMTYLRQVFDETLRKYPSAPISSRQCNKEYVEPDTGVTIAEGTLVFVFIRSLHYDPEYFPNPEVFDPERFSKENMGNIKPFSYIPFGDGPRNCLGRRFAIVQTMLAIAEIVRNYRFTLHSKTQLPVVYNPYNFTLDLVSDFYLSMERITL